MAAEGRHYAGRGSINVTQFTRQKRTCNTFYFICQRRVNHFPFQRTLLNVFRYVATKHRASSMHSDHPVANIFSVTSALFNISLSQFSVFRSPIWEPIPIFIPWPQKPLYSSLPPSLPNALLRIFVSALKLIRRMTEFIFEPRVSMALYMWRE